MSPRGSQFFPRPGAAAAALRIAACVAALILAGCSGKMPVAWTSLGSDAEALTNVQDPQKEQPAVADLPKESDSADMFASFRDYGRLEAKTIWNEARRRAQPTLTASDAVRFEEYGQFRDYAGQQEAIARDEFFKGRYNRSRARLPENIGQWRSRPDIANPGPDLANFPNSAFTLPQGRAYVELSPFTYYGTSKASPAQYNTEFLLRYGVTDDIELRLFGNGVSWSGGPNPTWGFSPLAFDTKIQLWTEKPEWFLPAAGLEMYIQTTWLGSAAFDGGTQPSFTFNFDQSLPFDIDFEYNLGTTRSLTPAGINEWQFSFQWAFQRDLFSKDFAVFVHGFYNAMTLPRLPNAVVMPGQTDGKEKQNAVGAGFIWTANRRFALYGQTSGGTSQFTPSLISYLGFAVSF